MTLNKGGYVKDGTPGGTPPPPSGPSSLNVALYPYVPAPAAAAFQGAVAAAWQRLHADISLKFVAYDAYLDDPWPTLDVFAYDGVFASYFAEAGFVSLFPAEKAPEAGDLLPFALDAGRTAPGSETLCGLPYLGCMSTLLYRTGDAALAAEDLDLAGLCAAVGPAADPQNPQPPPGQGLLMDFTGGTTDACMYLQSVMEAAQAFPWDPALPPASGLDQPAMDRLRLLAATAGRAQAGYVDPGSARVTWFEGGAGRALTALTETLQAFTPSAAAQIECRPMLLAGAVVAHPFYTDLVSVNPKLGSPKDDLAFELACLISSREISLAGLLPPAGPQYLIPCRGSVLQAVADADPVYAKIARAVTAANPVAFRLGTQSRAWLNATKAAIRQAILGPGFDLADADFGWDYRSTPAGMLRKP
jgi:thiamine pyridinylase